MLQRTKGAADETELEEYAPHDSCGMFMCVDMCSESFILFLEQHILISVLY